MKFLGSVKEEMVRKTRYSTYAIVSVWKILFFFGSTLLILFLKGESLSNFFSLIIPALQNHKITVSEVKVQSGTLPDLQDLTFSGDTRDVDASPYAAIYILLIHVHAAYLCYVFGKMERLSVVKGKFFRVVNFNFFYRKIRLQDFNSTIQLRFPGKSYDSCIYLSSYCCLWFEK